MKPGNQSGGTEALKGRTSRVPGARVRPGRRGSDTRSRYPWNCCAFLVVFIFCLSVALPGQQSTKQISYDGQHVSSVDLVARPSIDVAAFRPLVAQRPDQPYSRALVQQTISRLDATGQFSKVEVEVKPGAKGLQVTFVMEPAFYIGMIYFPGASKAFSYPRLLQTVDYPAEDPYEASRVKQGLARLQGFLLENGYFRASATDEVKLDRQKGLANVVYHVRLDRLARFGAVDVTGPPPQEAVRLKSALHSFRARLFGAYLKAGKRYDPRRIQEATRFLQRYLGGQNYLASRIRLLKPHYDPETNRADLTFQVDPGPTVLVKVVGARISKRTLHKLIPIYEEASFDQDLVEEGERNLVSYFQSKGYFDVKVNPQTSDRPSDISLIYNVTKGNRHRVISIRIAGNHHFEEDDLMDQVAVKKARFFSRGKFSEDLLRRSVKDLTAYYQDAGFASVSVQPKVVDREPTIYVTFEIDEGPQTLVDSLHVAGNKTQPVSALAPDGLSIQPGKPYSPAALTRDRNQIVATYLDLGYLNADFKSSVSQVPNKAHRVAVTYAIDEGPRAHISQVTYLPPEHTRQSFIERNVDLSPGAPLSEGKILESESKLYNLGVFDWASVAPRRPITDQHQEDVLVKAHDAKRNSIVYGIGFESTPRSGTVSSGIIALPGLPAVALPSSFRVLQKNLISPDASVEYTRRDMRGRAETASIATLLSRLDQRASFTYGEPQFRGLAWSALWSLSAERTTQNPLFTARLGLASFQLERTLDAAKTRRVQLRYSLQRTSLADLLIQGFVPREDQSIQLSTLSVGYIRDTRDKPLDAHRGVFETLDFGITPELIGSSDSFARIFGQTTRYWQLKPWMVWANSIRAGTVKSFAGSHVPLSERFFSGGADSLRGFPLNGAGPQAVAVLCTKENDPSTCTAKVRVPTGGHELFIFNSEGRFPLPLKKGLGGVVFYDGGNVYEHISVKRFFSDYSNTVGVGLRYDTPVGPIRVDIGRNLNPVPGLKSTQIFITLGQSF